MKAGGPWQPDSSLKSTATSFLTAFPWDPGNRIKDFGRDTGRKAGSARGEGEDSAAPLFRE